MQETHINEVITEIEKLPQAYMIDVIPRVRYVGEVDLEDFLYTQTPIWETSMIECKDTNWWGFQDHTIVEHSEYGKWILWYWHKHSQKKFTAKFLSNNSAIEEKMKKENISRREIHFWKGSEPITATQWILGDYIISISTRRRPHYLVQIHDAIMAGNMREMYKQLWKEKVSK